MAVICLYISAVLIVITAAIHAALGEKLLIAPLMKMREGPLQSGLARRVVRLAWHLTSILMVMSAAILVVTLQLPEMERHLIIGIIGAVYLASGIIDGLLTRGQHIGWWFLTAAGGFALAAAAL
jgi:hypothetical protein